jgi:serine/threonine protein kinase
VKVEVEKLFHELADLPPEERERYFVEHHVDQETRLEVDALLAFDPGATAFLERGISIAASLALPQLGISEFAAEALRCGPYRLLELIGRGGMGAVYLAERADGEVTQRLAIKLLPAGAGDPQRERFLQERQILAALAHPNIARLLDAGHLDNGQPFLAMEHIDGKPIDVFAAGSGIRQKVALFLKVCAAVGYLHRNLIVHRDLKPSNILVTPDGEPKLLDFGIAKILDVSTDSTMTSMRMLTPDYASPEQVTGGRVTTATDIYSLGAVLYKLLIGRPPHEFEDQSAAAITSSIAAREVTRPSKLVPELKGDLECILLKTLRKDPQERYATVEQLREDLEAFLESRPVRARSGNAWYRTRKFLRRYRLQVTAVALMITSLSAGLYIAVRQRLVAERRFAQLREISKSLLDLQGKLASTDFQDRIRIMSFSVQYLEGLGREALHNNELALEISDAYLRVARLQGVPEWNQQGHYADAQNSLSKANLLVENVLRVDPHNRQALWLSANVAHDRAVTAYAERKAEQVLAWSPKAVEGFDHLARLRNLTRREINGATYIYGDLAEVHIGLHRFKDAAHYARLAIDYSRDRSDVPGPRAQAFNMLAGALMYQGDFQGASDAMAEARRQLDQLRGETIPRYFRLILQQTRCREGLALGEDGSVNLNRPREALGPLRDAFDALKPYAQNPYDYEARSILALSGHYLGDVLRHTDPARALEVYDHSLAKIREVPDDVAARRLEAFLLAGSSYAARWAGREKDAQARINAAVRLLRETKDYPTETVKPGSEADVVMRALAGHYAGTGQPKQAAQIYQELLRKIVASNPDPQNDLVNAANISQLYTSLAAALRRAGRKGEAVPLEASRLELWRHWNRKLPNNLFMLQQLAAAELACDRCSR